MSGNSDLTTVCGPRARFCEGVVGCEDEGHTQQREHPAHDADVSTPAVSAPAVSRSHYPWKPSPHEPRCYAAGTAMGSAVTGAPAT